MVDINWVQYGIGLAIALGVWFFGWMFTRLILPRIAHVVMRSETSIDDLLVASIRPHIPLWFLGAGIVVAIRYLDASAELTRWVDLAVRAGVLLSATLALASFLARIAASDATPWLAALPSTGLVQGTIRIVVIALGGLVVLSNMGVAITPILTALGVGSLAVALALQPTLTNLFAGFYITIAQQVRVGDFVELESGQKGFVTDIGWRTTTIRELPNNLIILPNSKISEIIVTNYSLPEAQMATVVPVGVSYDSDLEKVEQVVIEVGKELQKSLDGAVSEHEPLVRYNSFADSSINFNVILRAHTLVDGFHLQHEFIKKLHRRFDKEGIEIPFPQRAVHWKRACEDAVEGPSRATG